MSDKNGFYKSDEILTGVGGSDFMFAIANENIDPEPLFNEFIERIKYVDDFNDIMASKNSSQLIESLKHNISLLLNMATSVGLKLNDDKTKLMFSHLTEEEIRDALALVVPADKIDEAYAESKTYVHRLLGFNFSVRNNKISVDSAVVGLNGCCRIVGTMRKHGSSLRKTKLRLSAATKLIWAACYDLGLCYAYASSAPFEMIEKCMRKVVKASGLDWMTNSNTVYQVSTRLQPKHIAIKQIIQLGIKFLDPKEIKNNRYNIPRSDTDSLKPVWKVFTSEFEKLPQTLRESIIGSLEPGNQAKMGRIKSILKSHFLKQAYPEGEPAPKKIDSLISKNIYSYLVVEERKRKRAEKLHDANFSTPKAKRCLLSSKLNRKILAKCLAPQVSGCPKVIRAYLEPGANEIRIGPGKKKSVGKRYAHSRS